MKSMKALFIITALTASSMAMAAGGGDRTFARMERMEQARKVSMQAQMAQKQKAEAAVAESKAKAADNAND